MEMIQAINNLRRVPLDVRIADDYVLLASEQLARIKTKLETLQQTIDATDAKGRTELDRPRVVLTAELYRLSALLYLEQTRRELSGEPLSCSNHVIEGLKLRAFEILAQLEVCSSPWPLFIVACEAQTDADRIRILDIIDRMNDRRRIGNVSVLRRIIEISWNQQDLKSLKQTSAATDWRQFVNTKVPCFI